MRGRSHSENSAKWSMCRAEAGLPGKVKRMNRLGTATDKAWEPIRGQLVYARYTVHLQAIVLN